MTIRPRAIPPGGLVSLVSPAGPVAEAAIVRAEQRVRMLGWEPSVGRHAQGRHGYLSATDAERLADLDAALADPHNAAIWCLRGGYGSMRILPDIDLSPLRDRPRPLIGFSDNTVLHLLAHRAGVASFHGPHPAAKELSHFSLECLRRIVTDSLPGGTLPLPEGLSPPPVQIVGGVATAPLVGGNLSLLAATVGTTVQLSADGAILFFEDVGEPLYRIDRLLTQLRLSGTLDRVAGVLVGALSDCPDAEADGLPTIVELLSDRLGDLGVPVACGYPFGHVADSWTLPLGIRARLDASAGTLELIDAAVIQ
jgi:muramoyltetrapeptide carboxypeptidase